MPEMNCNPNPRPSPRRGGVFLAGALASAVACTSPPAPGVTPRPTWRDAVAPPTREAWDTLRLEIRSLRGPQVEVGDPLLLEIRLTTASPVPVPIDELNPDRNTDFRAEFSLMCRTPDTHTYRRWFYPELLEPGSKCLFPLVRLAAPWYVDAAISMTGEQVNGAYSIPATRLPSAV